MGKGIPSGVDLMRSINEGLMTKVPLAYVKKVRQHIIDNCEEILDIGCRIRPLIVSKKQIGWVRGVHNTERKILQRWLPSSNDFIFSTLKLATTLTEEKLENFSAKEIVNLATLIKDMSDNDISLFPYLSAYTSTMSSENLWHGKGTLLSSFENRLVSLPDGKQIKLLAPSEHARLWATLATYREQAKKRLDENWNAVLVARPWAGKSIDPVANDLRSMSRQMKTDSMEPWENIIKAAPSVDVDDGWAHPSDSIEGLQREMYGMLNNDKHEQVIEKFELQQREAAEKRKRDIERMRIDHPSKFGETIVVETEAQVKAREKDLKKGKIPVQPIEREVVSDPKQKIGKYR